MVLTLTVWVWVGSVDAGNVRIPDLPRKSTLAVAVEFACLVGDGHRERCFTGQRDRERHRVRLTEIALVGGTTRHRQHGCRNDADVHGSDRRWLPVGR